MKFVKGFIEDAGESSGKENRHVCEHPLWWSEIFTREISHFCLLNFFLLIMGVAFMVSPTWLTSTTRDL